MKKLALLLVLGMSTMACRAQVRVATVAPQEPIAAPAPAPPPYEGGSTGWVVQPNAIRF